MGILIDVYHKRSTYEEKAAAFKTYEQYLKSIAQVLPPGARAFALAGWHYNLRDSGCPHDAWVEHLTIYEDATGERSETRTVGIHLKLLGANHDGHIEIRYTRVSSGLKPKFCNELCQAYC
ncbi:MAG: hypothetical protein M1546_02125 [Chloroflexi bacterium]|nr:hypothetical protein [Chloroflexota bacterium]